MLEVFNRVALTIRPDTDNPFLQGCYQPNDIEYTATSDTLQVIGEIPKDLFGIYIRNTHNQVHEPIGMYHPFDGDGMLHAMFFHDGKVEYRNRFVRTTGFFAEQGAGRSLWPGLTAPDRYQRRGWGSIGAMKDNAGTDVIAHGGRLLASMSQCSEPYRLDPVTLETFGPDAEWGPAIMPHGISSHFKTDPETGEMMFFNYGEDAPYMNYGVVDPDNRLVHYVPIDLPGCRWPHDMAITKNYAVLHDLPMFFDPEKLAQGRHRLRFYRDIPSRFGIIPRRGRSEDIRWFEGTPCYILHLANGYEDGDEVVMDGCISLDPTPPAPTNSPDRYARMLALLDKHNTRTRMHRWRFNLKTGQTHEEFLDDEVTEFPIVSNDFVGRPYRYSYNALFKPGAWLMTGVKRFDLVGGGEARYDYGEGRFGSEAQIGRRVGATAEDDGYLLTFVTDLTANRSECLVLNAADIAAGPVARIVLPHRISVGTHACWVEGDRIRGERIRGA
ncbi:MAG TPA: carotenoid oxygenase family protein [Hyphomicrobiales bacterium]|nr:carotenoid oxygenase family protein [Hyphomicrobiales bacterium]